MNTFHNKTRKADSIPDKLRKNKKSYLIPMYYLLTTSDLAREGIHHSGSYRFADHIYAGKAKGKYGIGKLLDAILLSLPSATAFRYRYEKVKEHLASSIKERNGQVTKTLYVPPGLAREYFEVDALLHEFADNPSDVHLYGLDLDEHLVGRLNQMSESAQSNMMFTVGDALDAENYDLDYNMVLSTGFLDFLPDTEAGKFFELVYNALAPGGTFITSGMQPHRLSDYLMREFAELHTVYRTRDELLSLAQAAGFDDIQVNTHKSGLQTVIIATK